MSAISPDQVIKAYSAYAPFYDQLFGAVLGPGRRALTAAVCRETPGRLLEVGVGTGLTLAGYPKETAVVGVDVSAEMLAIARRRASKLQGRDIDLRLANGEHLDFPDSSFDCVALPYVISVTPKPEQLVREVRRVCKPGGAIVIVNHFSGSRFWWLTEQLAKPLAGRIGFRSSFSYEREVLTHDWRVEQVESVNLFGLSKLVIVRNVGP